jgi:hypothetical protein
VSAKTTSTYVQPTLLPTHFNTLARLQKVFPWLFSEYIASFPLHAASSGLFALILYFLTNMRTEDLARNLFIFIGECVLVQIGTVGFALLAASLQVRVPFSGLEKILMRNGMAENL